MWKVVKILRSWLRLVTNCFVYTMFSNEFRQPEEQIDIFVESLNAYVMSDIEKVRLFDNQKIRSVWVKEEEE